MASSQNGDPQAILTGHPEFGKWGFWGSIQQDCCCKVKNGIGPSKSVTPNSHGFDNHVPQILIIHKAIFDFPKFHSGY